MFHNRLKKWKRHLFYYSMITVVAISMIISFLRSNVEHIFLCILTLLLFWVPQLLKRRLKLYIPPIMEVIIVVFIVCGIVLGEIANFFVLFPYWDTVLHTLNGIVCAALSLSLVVLLNKQEKVLFRLSPIFLMLVAISFAMLIGVLWEFFEFSVDCTLNKDMQKDTWIQEINTVSLSGSTGEVVKIFPVERVSINNGEIILDGYLDIGLFDTMEDLFVTFIGAVAFNLWAALYNKKHKGFILDFLIDTEEHTKSRLEEESNGKKNNYNQS